MNPHIDFIPSFLSIRLQYRTLCWISAFICLIVAAFNPQWGKKAVPQYTDGNSVALVFDISYSMTAQDVFPNRLVAATHFARSLLEASHAIPFSLSLAKGNGIIAIPLTYDYQAVYTMLDSLSPYLLTAIGSDIGSGVLAALRSFPADSAQRKHIILFSDADETVETLEKAVQEAVLKGCSITIIGVGTEEGSHIIAGDGKTSVMTYLQEEKIQEIIARINKKYPTASCSYYSILQANVLQSVLKEIQGNSVQAENRIIDYRMEPINHSALFLLCALVLFSLGIIIGELKWKH